jgi:hypothetical protein
VQGLLDHQPLGIVDHLLEVDHDLGYKSLPVIRLEASR